MKLLTLLLSILTLSVSASQPPVTDRHEELIGHWLEDRGGAHLEIRYHRDGLKVREIKRNARKGWDIYHYRGRDLYDNYKGKTIKVTGYDGIVWKRRWKRTKYLSRDRPFGRDDYRRDRYRDYRYGDRYGRDEYELGDDDDYEYEDRSDECGADRYRRGRGQYDYSDNRYIGDWYCDAERLSLEIERFGVGIRARRPNRAWVYYDGDARSGYRDREGNRYFFDSEDRLCWESSDRRRVHRFERRY